jgi:hypothetical protein
MFWEHTAASSMTLQPSQLPSSMQHFAATHNRCLQRIVWALPKILAFLLVAGTTGFGGPMSVLQCVNKPMSLILTVDPPHRAGTHYQFLWYMARVFLPGRRQLCKLSALVQPKHYADILTQKVGARCSTRRRRTFILRDICTDCILTGAAQLRHLAVRQGRAVTTNWGPQPQASTLPSHTSQTLPSGVPVHLYRICT